jgi:hypothetical protein
MSTYIVLTDNKVSTFIKGGDGLTLPGKTLLLRSQYPQAKIGDMYDEDNDTFSSRLYSSFNIKETNRAGEEGELLGDYSYDENGETTNVSSASIEIFFNENMLEISQSYLDVHGGELDDFVFSTDRITATLKPQPLSLNPTGSPFTSSFGSITIKLTDPQIESTSGRKLNDNYIPPISLNYIYNLI